jgi:hypothetical protein
VDVQAIGWDRLLGRLEIERLSGLAVARWEAGWLELTKEQAEELLVAQREAMLLCLQIERSLLQLAERFDLAEIEFVVLKGPALAHTVYQDPSWRPFGDLDVLVRTRDWRRALDVLAGMGFRRRLPEPRSGFDERFGKAATHDRSDGVVVDLHRTLAAGPFGLWIEPEELFRNQMGFRLGGREFQRLGDTPLLAHACIHASLGLGNPLAMTLRDIAQIAASQSIDRHALDEWSNRWHLGVVFQSAFESTNLRLGGFNDVTQEFANRPVAVGDRKMLAVYKSPRRERSGPALAALRAIPGIGQKIAYIRALLVPQRSFRRARGAGGRLALLRRWQAPIRWLVGRSRT